MKLLGIAASPRPEKTTHYLVNESLESAREVSIDIETELIDLGGILFRGCVACGLCKQMLDCSIGDSYNDIIPKLAAPDVKGMIFGSPVYMGSMSSQMKAFIDRSVLFRRNDFVFRGRVGGAIAVGGSRNGGQELTIQAIHAAMGVHDMVIVADGAKTSHFGGSGWSGADGGIEQDEVGINSARNLGRRVAEVMMQINKS